MLLNRTDQSNKGRPKPNEEGNTHYNRVQIGGGLKVTTNPNKFKST
jgi:hypothetical protein